jgi:hypothetical protein
MWGKKIIQAGLLLAFLLSVGTQAQTISPNLFGVNAWMPDTIGDVTNCASPPCIKYGKLHKHWQDIEDSKASTVRYGGIGTDQNMPTHYQYIRMVDSMRAHGIEPILQVPFWNYRYTAQDAADIVRYVNVTMGRHVKYWIIGNEPNLSYSYTTAAQIAAYFRPFASAMKSVDPSILIVGPETASFKYTITNDLTTPGGPDDITGKDANGNYYLDVFTFHTYPFGGGTNGSRAALVSNLMASGKYYDNINYVKSRLAACDSYHSRSGADKLSLGITEVSVNYTNPANDNLNGLGTYSFLGAQFVAEMYGIGMKTGVNFINLWSVIEGNSITSNCGYLDKYTLQKRPLYYHFQMMAENFKGENVACMGNQPNVKQFSSKDAQTICVMLMNEDSLIDHNYTLRLDSVAFTSSGTLKVNANAHVPVTYSDVLPNQSTVMLVFNLNGNLIKKCEYSLAAQATAGLPPQCSVFGTTGLASNQSQSSGLDMHLYPNPNTGVFTIELINGAREKENYDLEIMSLVGEVIYSRRASFDSGKERVVLEGVLPKGMYIVRLNDGEKYIAKRVMLQ